MNKQNIDKAYFISFCIEQYKNQKGLTGEEAARILGQYGVLDYLNTHFEVLHTQSKQWIMADIDEFIEIHKKEST